MKNIRNLYQVKSFIWFPIFTLKEKQKVSSYVIYFTFFGTISFDVPFISLEAMAWNNK
jgi:hypothetical protein